MTLFEAFKESLRTMAILVGISLAVVIVMGIFVYVVTHFSLYISIPVMLGIWIVFSTIMLWKKSEWW